MFALIGISLIVLLVYVRPQEFSPLLTQIPLLYVSFALSLFGVFLDLRLRFSKLEIPPHHKWIVAYLLWCFFSVGIRDLNFLVLSITKMAICMTVYWVCVQSVQGFKSLQKITFVVSLSSLFVAFVCAHQGMQALTCIQNAPSAAHAENGIPDGRPCEDADECYTDGEPGSLYRCERPGWFGTHSVGGGRVRYLGILQDPNEVALVTNIAVPFSFAMVSIRRSFWKIIFAILMAVVVVVCTLKTQSRGGQLIFLTVLGTYFIRRYGWKAGALGGMMALPLLLLAGGSERSDAAQSKQERLEVWHIGMQELWKQFPLLGVGHGRFEEFHHLTAHNSYILEFAELGLLGSFFWYGILYISMKTPFVALVRYQHHPEHRLISSWATALIASLAGLYLGIMFLSFSYHLIFWVYIGLSAGFYVAIKRHDPEFSVETKLADFLKVGLITLGALGVLWFQTRHAP